MSSVGLLTTGNRRKPPVFLSSGVAVDACSETEAIQRVVVATRLPAHRVTKALQSILKDKKRYHQPICFIPSAMVLEPSHTVVLLQNNRMDGERSGPLPMSL